jgi:steroid 5-alpha reductase family enzyme
MLTLILAGTALVLLHATAWFVASVVLRRNDIADVAWGLGFILLALFLLLAGSPDERDLLLTTLVVIWGSRLSIHIHVRNRGHAEDFRYREWREEWDRSALVRSFLQVFLLQGLILVVIATPLFLSAASEGPPLQGWATAGTLVWIFGFAFETIADEQLRRFKANEENRGRVLTTGLWRYTRHPNYFGEVVLWWGIFLIALPVENGWWAAASPLLLTFLILKLSGIPLLERKYEGNPEYEAYRRRTSAFIPLPPGGPEG